MIGLLRRQIEIQSPVRVADEAGGAALEWTTLETVWAGVRRLGGARVSAGETRRLARRIAATVRYRAGVSPGQRARFEGVDYEIVSIETDDGRERYMVLICEEAAP